MLFLSIAFDVLSFESVPQVKRCLTCCQPNHVTVSRFLPLSLIKAGNKPPSTSTPGKPKKATTFQEFESITSDAWDVGDDDDELLAMAAQNLNIEVVMETANKVIENHSKLQERRQQQQDEVFEPEEKEEEEGHEEEEEEQEEEEEAAETTAELSFSSERLPHSDSRLVKSHSEAPIGSPKGQYTLVCSLACAYINILYMQYNNIVLY